MGGAGKEENKREGVKEGERAEREKSKVGGREVEGAGRKEETEVEEKRDGRWKEQGENQK